MAMRPLRSANCNPPCCACKTWDGTSREFFLPEVDLDWHNLSTGLEPLIDVGTERWEIYLPLEHCLSYKQCDLIRELSGNPFRPILLDPLWLHWNDGCIGKMARTIYNEERFEDLPILADALEEAGCSEGPLLRICGKPPHPLTCVVAGPSIFCWECIVSRIEPTR